MPVAVRVDCRMTRKIFVTTALPYANGPFHIGHIMEYIQADIWVRFQRMLGNRGAFRGRRRRAWRAHHAQGRGRRDHAAGARRAHRGRAAAVPAGLSHQLRSLVLHRFAGERRAVAGHLPAPEGRRPHLLEAGRAVLRSRSRACSWPTGTSRASARTATRKDQYGDACEVCSTVYAPTDLINPYSTLTGRQAGAARPPTISSSGSRTRAASSSCAAGSTRRAGCSRRSPTRRGNGSRARATRRWATGTSPAMRPISAFRFPMRPGKYFYVWLDAPIGYLASLKNYFDSGKARAQRRAAQLPGVSRRARHRADPLHRQGHHLLPHPVLARDAEVRRRALQGSRPRVRARLHHRLRREDVQVARHRHQPAALPRSRHESRNGCATTSRPSSTRNVEDIDFNPDDFIARVNSDLIGKYVNIASRAANFITKHFGGELAYSGETEAAARTKPPRSPSSRRARSYEAREFGKAMREIMAIADRINQDFDGRQPWVLAKDPAKLRGAAGRLLARAAWLQVPDACCSRRCCPQ